MKNKTTMIYRVLIRKAFELAWQRKTLWFFGLFAAIISTGGVLDLALTGMHRIRVGGSFLRSLFDSSFAGYSAFSNFVLNLRDTGTSQTLLIFLFGTLVAIGLLLVAVLCQASLIQGIKEPEHIHPNIVRKRASVHVISLLITDILVKIIGGVFVSIGSLPMLLYFINTSTYSAYILFLELIVLFPAILILNILSMLTVIHIVDTGESVSESVAYAWYIFSKQWLATFEYALIVFSCVFILGSVWFGLGFLLSLPYALIYSLSLLSGSTIIFLLANVLFALVAFLVMFILGGAIISFQYACWYAFYKQTFEAIHIRLPISKILRMMMRRR